MALKKEVSELRAKLASQEEDYHKSEGEMHAEVFYYKLSSLMSICSTRSYKFTVFQKHFALRISLHFEILCCVTHFKFASCYNLCLLVIAFCCVTILWGSV